jgi:hypothetical protein
MQNNRHVKCAFFFLSCINYILAHMPLYFSIQMPMFLFRSAWTFSRLLGRQHGLCSLSAEQSSHFFLIQKPTVRSIAMQVTVSHMKRSYSRQRLHAYSRENLTVAINHVDHVKILHWDAPHFRKLRKRIRPPRKQIHSCMEILITCHRSVCLVYL